jgi:excinuclease ABC subunit C
MDKKNIKNLSANPGVYIFKDASGVVLYIGKATNLKNRVGSYFSRGAEGRPVQYAISQISKIETMETDSVLEALILESNLIKKYQPKYNVDLKDDKSFSYAVITKEKFPRVLILRKTDLENNQNKKIQNTSYKLRYTNYFGPYTSKKQLEIALKIIRKIFPYHSLKQQTEKGCLDYQIGLCPGPYADNISRKDYLKNIRNIKMILEGKKKNLVIKLEKEMKEYAKKHEFEKAGEIRNKIFALNHIRDIALIARSDENFQIQISNFQSNSKLKIQNSKFLRLEAYDISNISGQYAVGSMIVFKNNEPDKSQYRKFKIKTIQGADDVGMMREVLLRRFNNKWPRPDLILLDGGKGYLNMGSEILKGFDLNIPIIAVAKGVTRKISNFQFIISNQFPITKFSNDLKNIASDKNLLGQIMSEAHRFAIEYHRKVRGKDFTK